MILKSVIIRNFKGIEESTVELKPGFNLLIGDNGFGKTSILEAISVALGGFIAGIGDVQTKHFTKDEIRVVLENTGDGSYNKRYMTPVSVECEAVVEEETFTWIRRKSSLQASRSTVEPRNISKKAYEMANEGNHILPILSYQSTARMWMQKREATEDVFAGDFSRIVGYQGCLMEAANVKMLMNWIRRMERIEWKGKREIGEYRAVKRIVCEFMRLMSDEDILSVEYDDRSDELVLVTEKEALPIRNLSSGYQSLIWMVLDIAFRMAVLNPDLRENINQAPGVILIDELDMHLHPKWQWNVVKALKEVFPKVQFIAATHSPIILASCKDENLIMISERKEISYDKTQYGLDLSDVLGFYQNSVSVAPEINAMLMKFTDHVENEEYTDAEKDLRQLKAILGNNHPKVTGAETTLMLETIPLED